MRNALRDVQLLSFIGRHDRDILPLFLAHYRRLGVRGFLLALHGDWPEAALDWVTGQDDVAIWDLLGGAYEDSYKRSVLNVMAERHAGSWVVLADADEFLELPYAGLERTIRALEVLGLDCLPGYFLQRLTADGRLPLLDPALSVDAQFPLSSFGLTEAMGVASPVWKTKYPLARVTDDFKIDRGNHWPPNPMSLAHAPVRGVVHHVKWRATLHEALDSPRGQSSNYDEMEAFGRWLERHDGRLPLEGARRYSRDEVIRQGLLVKPDRRHLRIGSTLRQLRDTAALSDERRQRLTRKLKSLRVEPQTHPAAGPNSNAARRACRGGDV